MITPALYDFPPVQIQLLYCHYMESQETWLNQNKNLAEPDWRFYWNRNSTGWLLREGKKIMLGPEKAVLIAPNTDFEKGCSAAVQHFHMHFHVGHLFDTLEPQIFEFPMDVPVCKDIGRITDLLEKQKRETAGFIALTTRIIAWALANISPELLDFQPQNPVVASICNHIEINLAQELANKDLAAMARMSTNAFISYFNTACGIPPRHYIMKRRVAKACSLLSFSRLSIEEIAATTGFKDRNYFSRVFAKTQGIGPAAYRKQKIVGRASD